MTKQLTAEEISDYWDCHDDDVIVNDDGDAYYGNRLIAPAKDCNPDFPAIAAWMRDNGFWPNVWTVNDHGNVSLYALDDQGNETYLGGLV